MMQILFILLSLFLFSCKDDSPTSHEEPTPLKLYVCDQGSDRVVILDASTDDLEQITAIDIDLSSDVMMETPHFVAIDEENGYWFVSTVDAGYIGMYDLEEDTLIAKAFIDDSPALLAADTNSKLLYVSKMMEMGGDNLDPYNQLEVLSYSSDTTLVIQDPIILNTIEGVYDFPQPHAISLDTETSMGTSLITATMTNDWLARVTGSGNVLSSPTKKPFNAYTCNGENYISLNDCANNCNCGDNCENDCISNEEQGSYVSQHKLFPLEVTQKDDYIFFSCRGGSEIKGQVQSWSLTSLVQSDVYEFETYSRPWHITSSPVNSKIYVVLSGTEEVNSAGLACLSYTDSGELSLDWETINSSFDTLHGVTVSADGSRIYVSSRGDGSIHVFDSSGNLLNTIDNVGMMMNGGDGGMSMGTLAGIAISQVQ